MANMGDKLKPCPFCGETVKIKAVGAMLRNVICETCEAQGPPAKAVIPTEYCWNSRKKARKAKSENSNGKEEDHKEG